MKLMLLIRMAQIKQALRQKHFVGTEKSAIISSIAEIGKTADRQTDEHSWKENQLRMGRREKCHMNFKCHLSNNNNKYLATKYMWIMTGAFSAHTFAERKNKNLQ